MSACITAQFRARPPGGFLSRAPNLAVLAEVVRRLARAAALAISYSWTSLDSSRPVVGVDDLHLHQRQVGVGRATGTRLSILSTAVLLAASR